MTFQETQLYHIYNRSINKETIFVAEQDYLSFLSRIRTNLLPVCNLLAWCLMPNHFHFLINTTEKSVILRKIGGNTMSQLSFGIKQLLSSYTKSFNRKFKRTGNLFQQKTKSKLLSGRDLYPLTVFHYIHQNPVRRRLVLEPEQWQWSSARDYLWGEPGTVFVNEPLRAEMKVRPVA